MDSDKALKAVKEIIAGLGFDEQQITRDAELIEDLNMDSLDIVETIMALEDKFQLAIADEDADKIKTVGDLADYLARQPAVTA